MSESDSLGGEYGFVFNTPLINDELGFRASVNFYNDPGFIDYDYVVRQGGVSRPDVDWNNASEVDANIRSVKDANGEKTLTARAALRWQPTADIDATFHISTRIKMLKAARLRIITLCQRATHYLKLTLVNTALLIVT